MKRKYEEENGITDSKSGSGKKAKKAPAPIAVQHKQLIVTSTVSGMNTQQGRQLPMVASTSAGNNMYDNFVQQPMTHMTWVPPAFTSEPKFENMWPDQQQQQQQRPQQQQLHIVRAQPLLSPLHDMQHQQQQHMSQQQQHGIGEDYQQLFSPLKFLNSLDVDRERDVGLHHVMQLQHQPQHISHSHIMHRNHHLV